MPVCAPAIIPRHARRRKQRVMTAMPRRRQHPQAARPRVATTRAAGAGASSAGLPTPPPQPACTPRALAGLTARWGAVVAVGGVSGGRRAASADRKCVPRGMGGGRAGYKRAAPRAAGHSRFCSAVVPGGVRWGWSTAWLVKLRGGSRAAPRAGGRARRCPAPRGQLGRGGWGPGVCRERLAKARGRRTAGRPGAAGVGAGRGAAAG